MTQTELKTLLDSHRAWLRREARGTRAVLTGAVLTGAVLTGADLTDADLTDADLTRAVLTRADLTRAVLTRAVLTGAVLTGAVLTDRQIPPGVPVLPNLDAQILAAIESGGTLNMNKWHSCKTTHCRAGWAITLAGEAGQKLEEWHGPVTAGTLIYAASRPGVPIPDFYASNESALASIRADAGVPA